MTLETCCGRCFGDHGLSLQVIPSLSVARTACACCGAEDVETVHPSQLTEYFEVLLGTYRAADDGKLLLECLRDDWELFPSAGLGDKRAAEVLAQILGRQDLLGSRFSLAPIYHSDRADRWDALREELIQRNRYFPATEFDEDRLEHLLVYLIADVVPATWFRARLLLDANRLTLNGMGAPPPRLASSGRANPPGIPYLYLASNSTTAISEVRPLVGETVAVAKFRIDEGLKLIDLRSPRERISPFLLETEEEIGRMLGDIALLKRLGAELTRPVPRSGGGIDYVPSQFVCEFAKKCRYDGVIYSSSVASGMNLALFSPATATAKEPVAHFDVTEVRVDVRQCSG